MPPIHELGIAYPDWVRELDWEKAFHGELERLQLAIEMARRNVLRDTGGPFGAAVFERSTGRLVSIGVNLVVPLSNSVLHAEIVAFMMAEATLGTYSLAGEPGYALYTSCEPCAMCLGATSWAGVARVVWAATRADAASLHFDEGPVFPESYEYLRRKGVEFEGGLLRDEAREVLQLYRQRGGVIYNG